MVDLSPYLSLDFDDQFDKPFSYFLIISISWSDESAITHLKINN